MGSCSRGGSRFFWGGLLVLLGATFLAENLGVLRGYDVFSVFWPVLLVYMGLGVLAKGWRGVFWGGGLIIAGVALGLQEFSVISGNIWGYIWPALIMLAGLSILFRTRGPAEKKNGQAVDNDSPDLSAVFSEAHYVISSPRLTTAKVSAVFSESHVDLTQATPATDRVELRVDVTFGQVHVRAPAAWTIVVEVKTTAGEIKDRRPHPLSQGGPVLTLRGDVTFGSIELL